VLPFVFGQVFAQENLQSNKAAVFRYQFETRVLTIGFDATLARGMNPGLRSSIIVIIESWKCFFQCNKKNNVLFDYFVY